MENAELDRAVRAEVYRRFVEDGRAPAPVEIATALATATGEAEAALRRLADAHLLVLAPGTASVWMANPFSAVVTSFAVEARGRTWWGNCVWDALGILAALGEDGRMRTVCPDCDESLEVTVESGEARGDGVAHFAVPAARWWDDIGFT